MRMKTLKKYFCYTLCFMALMFLGVTMFAIDTRAEEWDPNTSPEVPVTTDKPTESKKVTVKDDEFPNKINYGSTLSDLRKIIEEQMKTGGEDGSRIFYNDKDTFLSGSFAWKKGQKELTSCGEQSLEYIFTPKNEKYEPKEGKIIITVIKPSPKNAGELTAVCGKKLSTIKLESGDFDGAFEWKKPKDIFNAGTSEYKAVFTPKAEELKDKTQEITLKVKVTHKSLKKKGKVNGKNYYYCDVCEKCYNKDGTKLFDVAGEYKKQIEKENKQGLYGTTNSSILYKDFIKNTPKDVKYTVTSSNKSLIKVNTKAKKAEVQAYSGAKSKKVLLNVDIKASGSTATAKIPVTVCPLDVTKKFLSNSNRYRYDFVYDFTATNADRVEVRLKGMEDKAVDVFDKYMKSAKSTADSYINFSETSMAKYNYKLTFVVRVYHGKKKILETEITK